MIWKAGNFPTSLVCLQIKFFSGRWSRQVSKRRMPRKRLPILLKGGLAATVWKIKVEKSAVEMVADCLQISYLLTLSYKQTAYKVQQQIYCEVESGKITKLSLMCSGFQKLWNFFSPDPRWLWGKFQPDLGKMTHYFEFCNDWGSGIYPGPSEYMKKYFVAANGDSLFVHMEGQVLDGRLDHHPEEVIAYFTDPWEILGGTGRFKGASGHGMTDNYIR